MYNSNVFKFFSISLLMCPLVSLAMIRDNGSILHPEELDRQLITSVKTGDIAGIEQVLQSGANIQAIDATYYNFTPLHWATEHGNVEVMNRLLSHGASINVKNAIGHTPRDNGSILHPHMKTHFEELDRQEFFNHLKKLPKELQQKIGQLQDATIFLSSEPITFTNVNHNSAVAASGDKIVTGSFFNGTVKIWDINDGSLINDLIVEELEGAVFPVFPIIINDDKVGVCYQANKARIWDIHTGQLLYTIGEPGYSITAAAAINDDSMVAARSDGIVVIVNMAKNQITQAFKVLGSIHDIAINDDKVIVAGNEGVYILNINTGKSLHIAELPEPVRTIAISDNKIVTASSSGAKVWDIHTGKLLSTLTEKQVFYVVVSKNKIVTSGLDGIQIWDINTGKILSTLPILTVEQIAISGDIVITVGSNKTKIWQLDPYKGTLNDNPLLWIMHNANTMQFDFIKRAYEATMKEEDLIIAMPKQLGKILESDSQEQIDGNIYFSFPEIVRKYLRNRLTGLTPFQYCGESDLHELNA